MADHHDIVDSALDLLRSRHWAGPNTNPILEKALMQARTPRSRINLRLVLGLGAALIGCGAVAAATRPAWITTLLAQETRAATPPAPPAPVIPVAKPTVAAAAQPPKIERPVAPVKAPTLVTGLPNPPAPRPVAAAPVPVVEEAVETIVIRGVPLELDEQPAPSMVDAFWDSFLCGDFEACDHLAQMITNPPPPVQRISLAEAAVGAWGTSLLLHDIPILDHLAWRRADGPLMLEVTGVPANGEITLGIDAQGVWTGFGKLGCPQIIEIEGVLDGELPAIFQVLPDPGQPVPPPKP